MRSTASSLREINPRKWGERGHPAQHKAIATFAVLTSTPSHHRYHCHHCTHAGAVRTLAEAYTHREAATEVLLSSSKDLACVNLMCERIGQGCACRLALSLDRMPLVHTVDVRGNKLPVLPDSVWTRPQLVTLVASGACDSAGKGRGRGGEGVRVRTHMAPNNISSQRPRTPFILVQTISLHR
jgi:hypothetical protein